MTNHVATGTILADKYRLISLLGRGGMGEVWRAEHLGLRAPVAIKLMNVDIVTNAEAFARFNREAQAAASLRSPHVVQILDHGFDAQIQAPYIAMELMEGESLAQRLERVGRLSPADTTRIVTHIARALARAHDAGIVHRDLKPDNVFLVHNEDEEIAKVLDFGIAKANSQLLASGSGTRTGAVMGTPYYMSPEQISGAKNVDHRTDLWALGVMTFQCLTGQLPFNQDSIGGLVLAICTEPLPRPSALGPIPVGFDAWFERALARDAAQRFQSARELADELRQLCAGAPAGTFEERVVPLVTAPNAVSAFSVGPLSHTTPGVPLHGPSRKGVLLGVGAAVLLGAALTVFWLARSPGAHDGGRASLSASVPAEMRPPVSAAAVPVAEAARATGSVVVEPAAPTTPSAPVPRAASTVAPAPPKPAARPVQSPVAPPAAVRPATVAPPEKPHPKLDGTSVFDRRKG